MWSVAFAVSIQATCYQAVLKGLPGYYSNHLLDFQDKAPHTKPPLAGSIMSVLTGVLLDVSGSMEQSVGDGTKVEGGSWARSIFAVVNDLIKNDVTTSNHVFALGVGASHKPHVFDMLNTLNKVDTLKRGNRLSNSFRTLSRGKEEILQELLTILENSGAPRVRYWGKMSVLLKVVFYEEAVTMLDMLQNNPTFRRRFVDECLPEECKGYQRSRLDREAGFLALGLLDKVSQVDALQLIFTRDSVKEAVRKGMELVNEYVMVEVSETAAIEVQKALDILHGCVGERELTDERVDELTKAVRPFIFGGTPLIHALNLAKDLFSVPKYHDHHKLLFVLSDGEPADGRTPPLTALADLGVTVITCFITHQSISEPLRLYSTERREWEGPAKFMFAMSSTIATQQIPRTIFVKRGWQVDTENNETRLFCQVNHPKIISDVCDLAKSVVCCQDALSDVLATVSLDIYINGTNQSFGAQRQAGGTCYANATAAVLHLAMKRISGRHGGYPEFDDIRSDLISMYGKDGANTFKVVKNVCPQHRLQCEEVDIVGALKAVAAKRPVVAKFRLTDSEWDSFSSFYESNKTGILTASVIDISLRPPNAKRSGHAVVLTSFDSQGLRLMNSWGSDWADGGFFKVQNADVLRLKFLDVFWTEDDLLHSEKEAYAREGPNIAAKLLRSLKGLQSTKYTCPLCRQVTKVIDFSGHVLKATCPRCRRTFKPEEGDLAMNLYLTSLCSV